MRLCIVSGRPAVASMRQLLWTDGDLATEVCSSVALPVLVRGEALGLSLKAGAPPADEMLLMGLNATERKARHVGAAPRIHG